MTSTSVIIDNANGKPTDLTIQAAPGREIVWHAAGNDPTQPILRIAKAADFKFKGKGILLDGMIDKKRRVDNLVMITGACPGLVLEDLQFKSFARSAVFIMNAAGATDQPIKLLRLKTFTEASEKPLAAIYFDANPKVIPNLNDNIEIQEGDFRGLDAAKAIQAKDKAIFGDNVRWPGRWYAEGVMRVTSPAPCASSRSASAAPSAQIGELLLDPLRHQRLFQFLNIDELLRDLAEHLRRTAADRFAA